MTICVLYFCLCQAQAPQVTATFPANQALAIPANSSIEINFDKAINPWTVLPESVRVFGRWSGPASLSFVFTNSNRAIIATASEPFFAGEWITVSLGPNIQAQTGESMNRCYTFNYWIATAPGTLSQIPVDTIYLRQGTETFIQAYGAYAGDLNNDSYSDLTVINEHTDDLRILMNDGTGHYSDFSTISMGNLKPSPNEGADFNNDGEIDLAVSTAHSNEARVLLGDGTGNLSNMQTFTTGTNARGLVILDMDGNGHDDIFITNRGSGNVTTLLNDGLANFTVSTYDIDPGRSGETSCAVSDVNNDGIMDIFVGYYTSPAITLYMGDGEGGFLMAATATLTGSPWMIAAGDLNGDGNADVVSANSNGHLCGVVFGDGLGNLSVAQHYAAPSGTFPLAIDLGDVDGDGDLDMVTSYYASSNFNVFENDGNGLFTHAVELPSPNHASCAILHDRDNDGDLDITVTDEGYDLVLFYENDLTCPRHQTVNGPLDNQNHSAYYTIQADALIPNGTTVNFMAGECVFLNPEFEVAHGATFQVKMEDCGN